MLRDCGNVTMELGMSVPGLLYRLYVNVHAWIRTLASGRNKLTSFPLLAVVLLCEPSGCSIGC